MMGISDLDNLLLLIQRVGDIDPITADPVSPLVPGSNGIIQINSDRIWNKYVLYQSMQPTAIGHEIFDRYFMITAAQLCTAVLANRVSFSAVGTAVRVDLSDRWEHYKAQMDVWHDELAVQFQRAAQYATPNVAPLLRIMPIMPPVPGELPTALWELGLASPFVMDANSSAVTGSSYWSQWRRW